MLEKRELLDIHRAAIVNPEGATRASIGYGKIDGSMLGVISATPFLFKLSRILMATETPLHQI